MAQTLKTARVAVAAAIAAAGLACAGNPPPGAAREINLRVASYNIQAGGGNLEGTVEAIRGLAIDVLGLQEVDVHWSDRSRFANQAAELGRQLGMHVRFAPIYQIENANPALLRREFGVALLSRFAIREFRNDSLTRLSTQNSRSPAERMPGLLTASLDVGGQSVRVVVPHLDYRPEPSVRARQVAETLEHLRASEGPTILLGDLNATPDAAELQPLFAALSDAWDGNAETGFTYPADKPVKRIDYVLVSRHFRVRAATVPAILAADHRPVVADLTLGKSHR